MSGFQACTSVSQMTYYSLVPRPFRALRPFSSLRGSSPATDLARPAQWNARVYLIKTLEDHDVTVTIKRASLSDKGQRHEMLFGDTETAS